MSVVRIDGSSEAVTVETRSMLAHDLAHLATESTLATDDGFFGRVAAGAPLHGRWDDLPPESVDALMVVESVAARVQGLWSADLPAERWADALDGLHPGLDRRRSGEIHERLRRLHGRWQATSFDGAMVLGWPDLDER
ncbi:MAG: hypothetical protein AAGD35_14780 [Actinomycetota bacterium]